ncbi:MAG: hypothetical protein DWQ10_02200, partial [Calditrichaeota bacterium]
MFKKSLLFLLFAGNMLSAHGNILTLDLRNMSPHSGQKLQVRVVDKYNNQEVARKSLDAISEADFMMFFDGIEPGGSYRVDFYADLNDNGKYDNPPGDHTWRLEVDDVQGDTTLSFSHNTNFTSLAWQAAAVVTMQNMNPHVGQHFEARLVDKKSRLEISRFSMEEIDASEFSFSLPGIVDGDEYYVEFFSDHNGNKLYDAPPADHTWQLEFKADDGDANLNFSHNTNFTPLAWSNKLALQMSNMTPHVGQALYVRAIDVLTGKEVGRTELAAIPQAEFEIFVVGSQPTGTYRLEFFADHNGNGLYDNPPADHAWSVDVEATAGDAVASFQHNTDFTLLAWDYRLWLEMHNMSPHMGQALFARAVDQSTGQEVGRSKLDAIYDDEFYLLIPGIQLNTEYTIDFFADHNVNNMYDTPPADHAWRMTYNPGDDGDNDLEFSHNTDFTDIAWTYTFNLNLTNMTPHAGQYFELRLVDATTQQTIGTTSVNAIPGADFSRSIPGLIPGNSYNADFYSDHNGNKTYDAPPADHAWRESFTATSADETLTFSHNTTFVDIGNVTGVADASNELVGELH